MKQFAKVSSTYCSLVILSFLLGFQVSQACYIGRAREDLNNDGKINIQDVIIAARIYGYSPGQQSWNPVIDIVPDEKINIFDVVSVAIKLGLSQCPNEINSSIQITPRALNLKSNGRWVTGRIKFPNNISMHNINISSIMLNEMIPVESTPIFTEGNNETEFDFVMKFDRQELIDMIIENCSPNKSTMVMLTVSGRLINGTLFRGSDVIKILNCLNEV